VIPLMDIWLINARDARFVPLAETGVV
jgi:hypothetical protein